MRPHQLAPPHVSLPVASAARPTGRIVARVALLWSCGAFIAGILVGAVTANLGLAWLTVVLLLVAAGIGIGPYARR
jgi:uncharacterized membrane protein